MNVSCSGLMGFLGMDPRVHVCVLNQDGKFYHNFVAPNNYWGDNYKVSGSPVLNDASSLQNSGSDNIQVACGRAGGFDLHVCLLKKDGRVFHGFRKADGNWDGFNDTSSLQNSGSDNIQVACAGVGGFDLHVCLLKKDGKLFHAIRKADGNWDGFNDTSSLQNSGSDNIQVACVEVSLGELHVCLLKKDGRVFHAIRKADGNWDGFNDASSPQKNGGDNIQVACGMAGGELHVCLMKKDGRVFHAIRKANGNWDGFNDASSLQNSGSDNAYVACSEGQGGLYVFLLKKNRWLYDGMRTWTGNWTNIGTAQPGFQFVQSL